MVGLIPFMPPIYAILIATAIYFGIKVIVGRRKKTIQNDMDRGFCSQCGEKITQKKCPKCDSISK